MFQQRPMVTCRDVIEETTQSGGAERTFLAGFSGVAPTRSYAILSDFKVLPPVASPLHPFSFSASPAWVPTGQIFHCPHRLNARFCPCGFSNEEWPLTGPSAPPPTGSPPGLSNISAVWLTAIQSDFVLCSLSSDLSASK